MMIRNWGALAATLGLLCAAAPAQAALYTVTYKGTVTSGLDNDLFGGLGSLTGRAWTAVFTVDTATPGAGRFDDFGDSMIYGDHGTQPTSAVFSLGGVDLDISGFSGSQHEGHDAYGGPTDLIESQATKEHYYNTFTDGSGVFHQAGAYRSLFTSVQSDIRTITDGNVDTPSGDYTVMAGDRTFGRFEDYYYELLPFEGTYLVNEYRAYADLRITSVSSALVQTGAVPEPGAWALMILGFGAVGGALRTRRRTALA